MKPNTLTFSVVLQPSPKCDDPIAALRRTLKYAGRVAGLRCVTIQMIPPDVQHRGASRLPMTAKPQTTIIGEQKKDSP